MMKFRTEIDIAPLTPSIDHTRRGFSVGSCFADRIAGRLRRAKFDITANPTGVLYNPFSIADALDSFAAAGEDDGLKAAGEALAAAEWVLVTFGTAWVYEAEGHVVANCGRRPASDFVRRRLSVEEIVARFEGVMQGVLAGKQVIFTVSPVRHLRDGFAENSLSKSILRVAVAEIVERWTGAASYFPAWEIVCDDLRDYRFYGADLVHPSDSAVEYIWEKFVAAALGERTRALLPAIEEIVRATEHRPFDGNGLAHREFRVAMLRRTLGLAESHPEVDLRDEIKFFSDNDI